MRVRIMTSSADIAAEESIGVALDVEGAVEIIRTWLDEFAAGRSSPARGRRPASN
jgi:hypothetical protein